MSTNISTNQPSILFDIAKFPEIPPEQSQFNTAMNQYDTNQSLPASTLESPINSLNAKISELKNIENSYKEFIERYNFIL